MPKYLYPWQTLAVGQSFHILNPYNTQYIAAHAAARAKGQRVSTRHKGKRGEPGRVLTVTRTA